MSEAVNHPAHYNAGKIEVIDAIEDWSTGWPPSITFHLGNAIKYVARAGKKDAAIQDLKKAVWYLERSITSLEGRPDADYRAKVVAALTREADLASGMGLLTSPERLRELAAMLETA